eukprot:CAMPEP_0185839512 /NCGR_PEP_ID=MMETSP1353-20130828/14686_1 /TAXON_ID=1077150 /ORGANISM="Erythrolobus australicus, Strain CCMP3124" /LENGTH=192 /DNA_ID=CAMNT_0028538691 /DNA_START=86 /DNA_END=661 /DNA_ORIENTATION=+
MATMKCATASEHSSVAPGQGQRMATKAGWTAEEDARLFALVKEHGVKKWTYLSRVHFESARSPLQLRCRYMDILRPGRSQSAWSAEEDAQLLALYLELGPKWKAISQQMPGRVENDAKNRFHKILRDGKRAMVDAQTSFDQATWIKHYKSTAQHAVRVSKCETSSDAASTEFSRSSSIESGASLHRVSINAL